MKNKKTLLIGIGILLLCCVVAVCVMFGLLSSGQVNVDVAPVSDEFDEEYTNIQRVDCDPYMKMDGVLDEPEWAGKQPFTNRFSDDLSMMKANLSMITHLTEKGVYVGVTVVDTNIVCDGLNAPRKNSTLQLSIAGQDANTKIGIHNVYMNAKNIVTTSNANVASCAYGVKVDGEINSDNTQKMTMELFLPWSAIGMETPENIDEAMVLLNPLYNAIEEGQTISKQLRLIPYSATTPDLFLRFSQTGFVDMDAEGAILGNSKIGSAKTGTWDMTGVAVDPEKSDDYTTSLTGSAKTGWGRYHLAYLTQASASSFVLEATVIPYSYNSSVTYYGFAGFAAMLPGEKQVSLRMTLNSDTIGTNANGQQNQKKIVISRTYQDFQNGVYDTLQVVDKTNANYEKQEGVRLKFIKNGSQYFMYADDVLVWAGNESRGGSTAFPALFSYNCQVEYKDIRYVTYEGRLEEMEKALLDSGTCLVSTEVEGAGSMDADTIAVEKGGSVTVTVSAMSGYILTDMLVNGESVMDDFSRTAFFEGTQSKYTIQNITEHTVLKAVYEQYEGIEVSGKVSLPDDGLGLDPAGTAIHAYLSDGRLLSFTSAVLADGSYSISLPQGVYSKLYFVHSHYEQIFYQFSDGTALKVGAEPLTDRDFTLTYPVFESLVIGPTLQTGDWYILDNSKYFARGNTAANNYNTAYFRDSGSDDFIVKATVKAEPGAMIGVMMNGTYINNSGYQMLIGFTAGGNKAITLFGWHDTARPVNWIGTQLGLHGSNAKVYPANNTYEMVIARKDDSIVMYVNGVQVAFWTGKISDFDGNIFDMSQFHVGKVGLSIRSYYAATFYDYSYSADEQELYDLMCSTVTFDALPEGVSVQVNGKNIASDEKVPTGKDIQVKFPVDNGKAYCVTVNGKAITHNCVDGVAEFILEKDSVIRVTESAAYSVSGTVSGDYSGTVIATNKNTGAKYDFGAALVDGKYTISLPDGSYKIYFDCGTREGMRNSTVVNGDNVADQDLNTTYQKLYVEFMGGNPSVNNSGMTANGVYYLTPAKNGNSNTIGYFNSTKEPVNNFVIKTHVNTQGGETGIMMYGYDGDKTNPDVLVHLSKSGMLSLYGWGISWKDRVQLDTTTYDPTSFDLCVVKNGNKIFVFIDGELVHTWDGSGEVKISQLTDLRVGLLVRGEIGATYSNYSMSTDSSAIYSALARKLTFDLPEGLTVTAGGSTLKSGNFVAIGTEVTVKLPKDTEYMYSITINGVPLEISYTKNQGTFAFEGESTIEAVAVAAYTVSGSVPEGVSGSMTATNTVTGQAYSYENILSDGAYSIRLPDGTYSLYFDCGKVEGMITGVTVSGADIQNQNLPKTYQKLTPYKMGDDGEASWILTGNGRYEVQTSNTNVNSVAMGYFADGVNLGKTDFVIHTTVEAPGTNAVLLGLTISNGKESVVYGLNNSNYSAQIRALMSNGWLSYQSLVAYDRTNFRLTIVKQGDTVTYFINGEQAAKWSKADYDFTSWSSAKVGLGIYRMYDVTFSDFSYSTEASDIAAVVNRTVTYGALPEGVTVSVASGNSLPLGSEITISNLTGENVVYTVTVNGEPLTVAEGKASFILTENCEIAVNMVYAYEVSGTVTGNGNGKVIATDATGAQQVFANALVNGAYSIRLGDGTYRLYFDCGDREGVITGVTVNGEAVTVAELTKTYQKLTPEKVGGEGTANWVMTENGRYEVQTSNASANSVSYGWFAEGVDMSSIDFIIRTNVEAAGNQALMLGLVVSNNSETVVFGLNNSNYSAQIRALMANGWPGYKSVAAYDRTNFELTILKKGNTVTYYIDGVRAVQWTTADYNFSTLSDAKIGIGFYRMFDVTFSDYSYSTDASDIEAVNNRTVTYGTLPEGVTVSVASGSSLPLGTEITVSNLTATGVTYTVTVNGKPIAVAEGKATFTLTENCEIAVTVAYGYTVSGTVGGSPIGTVIATDADGAQQVFTDALVDGSYSIQLSDGIYKLYFDCGEREGMITGVTVSGAAVTVPELTKTYQKLNPEKSGSDGTANWVMTENGRYEVQTSNTNVNSVSYGWFAEGVNLTGTDFIIHTNVEAAGNQAVMIGLVIGKSNETVVYGLNNSNHSAQIRVLQANGWPGYKSVAAYDRTSFMLSIVKKGTTITYYIDGNQVCQWTTADYNFSGWTDAKVGIGIYRMYDVTFSEYSYSTDASDIEAVNARTVTYGTLPEGVTVSVASGSKLPIGTEITVNNLTASGVTYTVLVNGKPVTVAEGKAIFTLTANCEIVVTATYGCKVSGTVAGELSGSVTAIDSNGGKQVFADALVDGSYSIQLGDGTYKLYFDCGDREGMITGVTVSGSTVNADLAKTYQKLTAFKAGDAGTANWVLTDNGRYEVQTSNTNVNSVTMGYFADSVNLATTDFVIKTHVKAAGNKAVMMGLVINNGSETVVYGLNNSNQTAQIRVLMANGWPGYRNVAAYDRTNYDLTIVKKGTTVTYYINGVQACQWTASDYNFSGWTNAKVGIGFYRMYDVIFSDYSYTTGSMVMGTVGEGLNGSVTATDAEGESKVFENALVDGSYAIDLPEGTYSLYFDCGDTEGLISNVTVSGGLVTANLTKTYQKLTVLKAGDAGTANWVLTGNGRYEVQTSNESVNSVSMGYFADSVNLATTDFVIKTHVKAAGNKAVMMGLVINNGSETVVYGLNNSNQTAQIRVLMANGWPGYRNVAAYDRTNYDLTIVKKGTTVTYYINGVQACQWTASDYNFSGFSNAKVGIGFYRMFDVTFSDYSYSTNADDIAAALQ